jgi:hypothetical protein
MILYYSFSALCNLIANLIIGSLVLWQNPKGRRNQTFACFCGAVAFWSLFYFLWQISRDERRALIMCRLLMFGAIWIPVFFFHYTVSLLRIETRAKNLLVGSYVLSAFLGLCDLASSGVVARVEPRLGFAFWPVPGPFLHVHLAMFASSVFYACWILFRGIQRHQGQERMQMLYSLIATIIGFGGGSINYLLWYNIPLRPVTNLAVSFYTVIIAYTIMRHRLMDISIIIRKTLIYSSVAGTLMALYLGVIALVTHFFEGLTGYETVFSSAVAAAIISFGFQPLRKRVQAFVDKKFFRQYVDREEKLYELSREVVTHTTTDEMGKALMRVITEALHPKAGALYLRAPDRNGFVRVSGTAESKLPDQMNEENALTAYFRGHPQPFVQDMSAESGRSYSTRLKEDREEAA